jgi:hypothetical protein
VRVAFESKGLKPGDFKLMGQLSSTCTGSPTVGAPMVIDAWCAAAAAAADGQGCHSLPGVRLVTYGRTILEVILLAVIKQCLSVLRQNNV